MASTDLLFGRLPATGTSVDLIFNDDGLTAVDSLVFIQGELPGLGGVIAVALPRPFDVVGELPGLSGALTVVYNSDTARPTVNDVIALFEGADRTSAQVRAPWQEAKQQHEQHRIPFQEAVALSASAQIAWDEAQALKPGTRGRFQQATRTAAAPVKQRFQEATRVHNGRAIRFQDSLRLPTPPVRARYQETIRTVRNLAAARFQSAIGNSVLLVEKGGYAVPFPELSRTRYQEARRPPIGTWDSTIVVPPAETCYTPPDGDDVQLIFSEVWTGDTGLLFVCEKHSGGDSETVVVPVRRVYMIQNEVSLRRVDGDIAIDCPSLQLSIDNGSWTWGFSATVPGSELSKLEPAAFAEPVELEALINGTSFRVLAEGISRERTFNRNSLRVSGRGRSASFDTPYATERTYSSTVAATAQQLAIDALSVSGVPSDWAIDWGPDDWMVPAGVWSHQGSPISALNRIAEAAGAYLQSHPSEDRLLILPQYPVLPWDWSTATPDFELPSDVVQREGIEWADKAVYDRIYVSGSTGGGVLAEITRAGTAGAQAASMITDALCTDIIAGRQRATPILANVGRQATVSLRLPVLPETGVIRPGAMVRYVDGGVTRLGLVRKTSVDAGRPQVWQTIGVQTYAD